MAIIDITNRCNMKCVYCNRAQQKKHSKEYIEPSLIEIINIFNDIKKNEILHVALQGGEPFLRSDLKEIIEAVGKPKLYKKIELKNEWKSLIRNQYSFNRFKISSYLLLKKLGFPIVSITTNGTIYSNELSKSMERNLIHLEVSIDSMKKTNYEKYRVGERKNYDQIIHNIRKYSRKLPVIIKTTVYEDNVNNMEEMIDFAYDLGCIQIIFTPLIATGRAKGASSEWISDYVKQVKKIVERGCEKKYPIIVEIMFFAMYLKSIEEYYNLKERARQASNVILSFHICKAYQDKNEIYINSNLDVYGCPQLLYMKGGAIGNLHKEEINILWKKIERKKLKEIIESRSETEQCKKCILLESCRAGCIANSKNFDIGMDCFCQLFM